MAKMQEHNNILSAKLDDTKRQLQDQHGSSEQLQDGVEQACRSSKNNPSKVCSHMLEPTKAKDQRLSSLLSRSD